jgi:enamine deaminase RidA (YjgF/YER057c/UK114 family)
MIEIDAVATPHAPMPLAIVILADLRNRPAMNEAYRMLVGDPAPARTAVQVAGLPAHALVEIDVIAAAARR